MNGINYNIVAFSGCSNDQHANVGKYPRKKISSYSIKREWCEHDRANDSGKKERKRTPSLCANNGLILKSNLSNNISITIT